MNNRILFVDDSSEFLDGIRQLVGDGYDVHTATSASEALQLCETDGPFAVVVTDHQMPGMNGTELLVAIRCDWSDTTRILMTGQLELDLAIRALHEGRIFRLLRKPFDGETLRGAIDAGVEQFRHVERERLYTEQLMFSRESLLSLTEVLEKRLAAEIGNLRSMEELAAHLNGSTSLEEVAQIAATAVSGALGGRGARVELENPHRGEDTASGVAGSEPSGAWHTEPVCTPEGEVGRIAVALQSRTGRELSGRDQRILSSLVSSTALAAHSQIRRRERDMAQHATVFAMARLAERRDHETGQHLARVSEYCRLLAIGLREDGYYADEITDSFIEDIFYSAPLHDIGKVGIPDRILLKPGRLTPEEWEIMKQHTVIGAETMKTIIAGSRQPGYLRMGHDIARSHHERWDGGGYPDGDSGEDIPLPARVLALADVYDALTTRRPYKEAWPHQKALELILSERGRHFDPHVTAVFERRVARMDSIRLRLADDPEELVELGDKVA
ncbi:MAG: response regulator [Planctomycetota bacterium]|nr:response regulator [Planctomycetota bacterium]